MPVLLITMYFMYIYRTLSSLTYPITVSCNLVIIIIIVIIMIITL